MLDYCHVAVRVVAADVDLGLRVDVVGIHGSAALRAALLLTQHVSLVVLVLGGGRRLDRNQINSHAAAVLRIRIVVAGAAEEHAGRSRADSHRSSALLTAHRLNRHAWVGLHAALVRRKLGLPQRVRELAVEIIKALLPVKLPLCDLVERGLHLGSEVIAHELAEALVEAVSYNLAHLLREKPSVLDLDVSAVLDGGDDRRVGRGAADATLLELLDQGAFGIARRRIGEVLGRIDVRRSEPVALMELGDGDVLVLHHHRPEHLRESVEADDLALAAELIRPCLDLNLGNIHEAV